MGRGRKRKRKGHWRARKKRKKKRDREVSSLEIPSGALCPLCKDAVAANAVDLPAQRCDGCQVLYHAPCLVELGGCSTLGCGLQGKPVAGAPRVSARERSPSVVLALAEAHRIMVEHQREEQKGTWRTRILYVLAGAVFTILSILSFLSGEISAGIGFGTLGVVAIGVALAHNARGHVSHERD